jgi:hypothetical protein
LLAYPFIPGRHARRLGRYIAISSFRFYLACLAMTRRFSFDMNALDALRGAPPLIISTQSSPHAGYADGDLAIARCGVRVEVWAHE